MNSELLEEFREEFLQKKEENDRKRLVFNSLMQRKKILENTRIIRDYVELLDSIEVAKRGLKNEGQLFLYTLFDYKQKGLVKETNDIFLYAGSFVTDQDYVISVERDSSDAEFDNYINIESLEAVDIPVEDRETFEKEHNVIILDENSPVKHSLYEIHRDFMYDAVTEGQEKACQKILKK